MMYSAAALILGVELIFAAPVLQGNATQPFGATNATGAYLLLGDDPSEPKPTGNTTQVTYPIQLAPAQSDSVASPPTADFITTPAFLESNPSFNFTGIAHPQPIRGNTGEILAANSNADIDRQNPDTLAPPSTDYGSTQQFKWPMSLSHNRIMDGGFARQENDQVLPAATGAAGVDFRLAPFAYREMHWHSAGEWSYMLNGSARIAIVDENGGNFIDNIYQGDLWFFPAGIPHSIQALDEGCEFLLVFDSGSFDEDDTLLISEWIAHTPKEVLSKNFQIPEASFDSTPQMQKYIFRGPDPGTLEQQAVKSPQGESSQAYSFHLSQQGWTEVQGGRVKIVDSRTFPVSNTLAAAEIIIDPGAIREMHWHFVDEWNYFISGQARITVFESTAARTFDYQAGDVGYIPATDGHYIENIGTEPLHLLEIIISDKFLDISMGQWLALTPSQVVMQTLNITQETYDSMYANFKSKPYLVS